MALNASIDCIDEGTDWKFGIPSQALASNSLYIEGQGNQLFRMMNKVAQFWEQKGITNYLVYTSSGDRGWEMIPVRGDKNSLWALWDRLQAFFHQLTVMARVTFGRYTLSESEKKHLYTEYKELKAFQAKESAEAVQQVGQDAFCKREVIESQLIWEGKHVRVLYNYAPIGTEGLHFLLTPKVHKEKFSELSQEEFEEVQAFAQTLIKQHPDHICYRYNKTGILAGQTVPHFHEHVVFVLPQHEFRGQLSVFLRMIIPPTPLNTTELAKRVSQYQRFFR